MKISNYIFSILICICFQSVPLLSQRPLTQIEGLVEIYDNLDSTSLYIGLESGQLAPASTSPLYLGGTFIGTQAGQNNDFGFYNTFVGYQSGKTNSANKSNNSFFGSFSGMQNAGWNNSFMGYKSGSQNTSGGDNSFFGAHSGESNKTGSYNTYLGLESGQASVSGHDNTFVGAFAGNGSTTGDFNTFIGSESGYHNEAGNRNSYFGYYSGEKLKDGVANTLLGYKAGVQISYGDSNIVIGSNAGPAGFGVSTIKKLYLDIQQTDDPLIYGEFENDLIRINGDLDIRDSLSTKHLTVDSNSIAMRFLGEDNDKGISWAESIEPVFGLIYDGEETGGNNKLHLRKYLNGVSNLMTYMVNGHIGIGHEDPQAPLHIDGGSDATIASGGYVILGGKDALNTVLDDNEIMARNNGANAPLNLNIDGGDVRLGGKIRIKDDVTPSETGQVRFNSTTADFEGYDGSKWLSLTNKKEHQLLLGPGSFYSDDSNITQAMGFDLFNGVTSNDGSGGGNKRRIIPISLPAGSTITQIAYFFKEDLPDMSLNMKLVKYDLADNNKTTAGFEYTSTFDNAPLGWTSANEFDNVTLESTSFYAVQFYSTGTASANHEDLLQYKGIRLTYTLP